MATEDQTDDLNARTQNFFRDVNERMAEAELVVYPSGGGAAQIEVFCECGRGDCTTFLKITEEDYALVRASPIAFVLLAGHETVSVEHVIRRTDDYVIAENEGHAALVAREGNPRSHQRIPHKMSREPGGPALSSLHSDQTID